MKTYTVLKNLFTNLSNNTSSDNDALGGQLISDQHRYLIQKYFDNERTVTTQTIGSMSLTLTSGLSAGATSGTLSSSWTYPTNTQLVNFSDQEQRSVLFTQGSATITWQVALSFNVTSAISTVGVQYYAIPANISKIINDTINVGQLKYQPRPIMSRAEWDQVNFLPYNSDIPQYYFIYQGTLGIFPIPSTTNNVLTFNYKTRVPDLSFIDYTTGNIAGSGMTAGSTSVTGTGTSWASQYPTGTDITFYNLYLRANPPNGDGIWYPISMVNSNTSLTLALPVVNAPNITSSTTYTIGQIPLLNEDFHDLIVYEALKTYYASIVPDANKFKFFESLAAERLIMLEDYAGTKSINVDLGDDPKYVNPNLFYYAN